MFFKPGPKKSIWDKLDSYHGMLATMSNKDRLLMERQEFLDEYSYPFLVNLNIPKSQEYWDCYLKIINVLRHFDMYYEQTLTEEEKHWFEEKSLLVQQIMEELDGPTRKN